jgi:hypothetical protein
LKDSNWRPNVAMVAYKIWMQAARELPGADLDEDHISRFLGDWSERMYTDEYGTEAKRRIVKKRFGLSRASTLLHFISGARFPIFDSRVRRAMLRLLDSPVRNTMRWYLDFYCPLFSEVARECGTDDLRLVDMALFSYGGRNGIVHQNSVPSIASLRNPDSRIYGFVRGMGQMYASGIERLEIHVNKNEAQDLKHVEGCRIEAKLIIGGKDYTAGIVQPQRILMYGFVPISLNRPETRLRLQ